MDKFNINKEHFGPESDDVIIELPSVLSDLQMPPVVTDGYLNIPRYGMILAAIALTCSDQR